MALSGSTKTKLIETNCPDQIPRIARLSPLSGDEVPRKARLEAEGADTNKDDDE
jgi:hypothetical protein